MPVGEPRVVIVDGGKQKKFVLVEEVTGESVVGFLKGWVAGEAKEYGLTDSVEIAGGKAEEEL